MRIQEACLVGCLSASLIGYNAAAIVSERDTPEDFHNIEKYEQLAQIGYDYFEEKNKSEELSKIPESPLYYDSSDPPENNEPDFYEIDSDNIQYAYDEKQAKSAQTQGENSNSQDKAEYIESGKNREITNENTQRVRDKERPERTRDRERPERIRDTERPERIRDIEQKERIKDYENIKQEQKRI